MADVSRRALLTAGIALPVAALLASCTEPPPGHMPKISPSPKPQPTSLRPGVVPSFGPNGTHYPASLPWLGEVVPVEVEVDCTWNSISNALARLTPEQVAEGVAIRVAPGELVGKGSRSGSTPVLSGRGEDSWTRNVLILPRDGYGTVRVVEEGIRINESQRISLFGFDAPDVGMVLTECRDIDLGWTRWSSLNITRSGQNISLFEVVLGFRRNEEDTFGVRPTDALPMQEIHRYGCAFGPSIKPQGSEAHCDSLQLEGQGTGPFGPFTSMDCVDFGSSNAAVLIHTNVSMASFSHCLILGERLPWKVLPLQEGDYAGEPNAFAGGCLDVRITDSIVCGPIGRLGYTEVHNTVLSYPPAARQRPSRSGEWTVDPSVLDWSREDILSRTGTDYSPNSLAAIWGW